LSPSSSMLLRWAQSIELVLSPDLSGPARRHRLDNVQNCDSYINIPSLRPIDLFYNQIFKVYQLELSDSPITGNGDPALSELLVPLALGEGPFPGLRGG
jgi:hypothetical protein